MPGRLCGGGCIRARPWRASRTHAHLLPFVNEKEAKSYPGGRARINKGISGGGDGEGYDGGSDEDDSDDDVDDSYGGGASLLPKCLYQHYISIPFPHIFPVLLDLKMFGKSRRKSRI